MNQSLVFFSFCCCCYFLFFFTFQVWLQGSSNHKTSNLLDHASSQQHVVAMVIFKKDQARAAGSSEIFEEGPPFKDFSADSSLELWWKDSCTSRRPNQGPRKVYRPRYTSSNDGNPSTSTSDSVTSILKDKTQLH